MKTDIKSLVNHFALIMLILLYFIAPTLAAHRSLWIVIGILLWVPLGLLAMINWESRRIRAAMLFLISLTLLSDIGFAYFLNESWQMIHRILAILTFTMVFIALIVPLSRTRKVTWGTISATVCAYITLAALWSSIYMFAELHTPGSFTTMIHDPTNPAEVAPLMNQMFYFSVVTIATAGGNIIPTNNFSRMLVSIEVIMGQLFVAVTIARIVALQVCSIQEKEEEKPKKKKGKS
ncbi:MAG: hypothetical protein A2X49_04180 [Lentisphaerae bacterium GWF2_52_8]|nr:MAG: hypothetical protein A2X49_04180 [Lentisphaerae bacterium GWF2_52_8]